MMYIFQPLDLTIINPESNSWKNILQMIQFQNFKGTYKYQNFFFQLSVLEPLHTEWMFNYRVFNTT